MSNNRQMLSARVPPELKQLVDADSRKNQDVVEAALWREFGGERKAAIERRIDEKENRISIYKREKREREREIEQEKGELEALRAKAEKIDDTQGGLRDHWYNKVRQVPKDPDHPLVQDAAEELDMTPETVLTEAYSE